MTHRLPFLYIALTARQCCCCCSLQTSPGEPHTGTSITHRGHQLRAHQHRGHLQGVAWVSTAGTDSGAMSDPLLTQSQVCPSLLGQPRYGRSIPLAPPLWRSIPLPAHSPLPALSSCQHLPGRPPTPGTPTPGTPARETPLTSVPPSLAPQLGQPPSHCPACWGGPGTHAGSPQHPSHSTQRGFSPCVTQERENCP